MSLRSHQYRKPRIYVTQSDLERLSGLAESSSSPAAALLGDELARATVVKDGDWRRNFVRLYSRVAFNDLTTGRSPRVQVVPPGEATIDEDRISVLTPVGAALIGLPVGESIGVRMDDGRSLVFAVIEVENDHAFA
jgi:regulator of nucleoside diphosphate kinase